MAKQAFDAKRIQGFWLPPEPPKNGEPGIRIIGLDTDDGPEHPLYDDRINLPLSEEFINNVDKHGILQTVTVRKNGEFADLIFGRQRVRAAREINKRRRKRGEPELRVPARREQAEDKHMMAMSIAENAARTDNDPIQEARDMQRLKAQGYDDDEVAIHFACSKQKVIKRMQLLELAPKVIKAVRGGQVAASAALALKSMPHEEQEAKLEEIKSAPKKNGKRPTQQQARAAAGRQVRPGVKQMKAMIESGLLQEATAEAFLQWWIGNWPPSKVKGLTAALKEAGIEQGD